DVLAVVEHDLVLVPRVAGQQPAHEARTGADEALVRIEVHRYTVELQVCLPSHGAETVTRDMPTTGMGRLQPIRPQSMTTVDCRALAGAPADVPVRRVPWPPSAMPRPGTASNCWDHHRGDD